MLPVSQRQKKTYTQGDEKKQKKNSPSHILSLPYKAFTHSFFTKLFTHIHTHHFHIYTFDICTLDSQTTVALIFTIFALLLFTNLIEAYEISCILKLRRNSISLNDLG